VELTHNEPAAINATNRKQAISFFSWHCGERPHTDVFPQFPQTNNQK